MSSTLKKKKMQAAQVYFPVDVYFEIKQIAQKEEKPLAEWVREVVLKEIKTHKKKRSKFSDLKTFSWEKKKHNTSENIDKILYDSP